MLAFRRWQLSPRSFTISLRSLRVLARPTTRPPISLESPRVWNRPLKKGVVPAYDLAVATLIKDSQSLKAEAKQIRREITKKEENYQKLKADLESSPNEASKEEMRMLDEELEKMLEKLHIVQVQSEVNLPDVRWKVNNAMGIVSLNQPCFP